MINSTIEYNKKLFPILEKKYRKEVREIIQIAEQAYMDYPNPYTIMADYGFELEFVSELTRQIHAQVDFNKKTVTISQKSIKFYESYLSTENAILLHLAHESFHILQHYELKHIFCFKRYRNTLFEVGAFHYSQRCANLKKHPEWYKIR